jgi:hypothetical protein
MVLSLKSAYDIAKLYSKLLIIGFVLFLLSSIISIYSTSPVVAQTPETSSSTTAPGLPTIHITTPQDGQQVPPGELAIQGISSDDEETDCQVYADVNDVTPMRNVTASGPSEEDNDFSQWTFTYTQDYQLIKLGANELTAKISCYDNGDLDLNPFPAAGAQTTSSSPLSEWHTVNITGVAGAPSVPLPLPLAGNTGDTEEDDGESNDDENSNDNDDENSNDNDDENSNDNDDDGNNDDEEDSNNDVSDSDGDGNNFFGGDPFFD